MQAEQMTGLVLAGGQGRRMGGRDKGLEMFADVPLIEHALHRLRPYVNEILINANRSHDEYSGRGARVVADIEGGYQGPLMGIWTGLTLARTPWVVVVPCDSPVLPDDLVPRLAAGLGDHDIAMAHDGERAHPVVALIRRSLVDDLGAALAEGERKIDRWYARHALCEVDFSDCPMGFANLNTEQDKARLERQWTQ